MPNLSISAKQKLAKIVAHKPFPWLMLKAVKVVVPRVRVGVNVVLFNDADEVLLLNHVFHKHTPWSIPGGWLGRGEDPGLGAHRELYEETNLKVTLGQIVFVTQQKKINAINIVYSAHSPFGNMKLCNEIIEARWIKPDQIPTKKILPFVSAAIHDAMKMRKISAMAQASGLL